MIPKQNNVAQFGAELGSLSGFFSHRGSTPKLVMLESHLDFKSVNSLI